MNLFIGAVVVELAVVIAVLVALYLIGKRLIKEKKQ